MTGARWLWLGLAVSVAMNLFLAGLMIGARLGGERGSDRQPPFPPGFERLSKSDRAVLEGVYRPSLKLAREERRGAREARRRAADALRAVPFDRTAAAAALDDARARHGRSRERADEALLDAAARMTPEGRERLAELIARGPDRSDRHRKP